MGWKLGTAVPLCIGGAGSPSNTMSPGPSEAYLRTKWYHVPSNRLATIDTSDRKANAGCCAPFLSSKFLGRPQPPNNKCLWSKIYAGSRGRPAENLIWRYWTKIYAVCRLRMVSGWSIFSVCCSKTLWVDAPCLIPFKRTYCIWKIRFLFVDISSRFEVTRFQLTAVGGKVGEIWGFPRHF